MQDFWYGSTFVLVMNEAWFRRSSIRIGFLQKMCKLCFSLLTLCFIALCTVPSTSTSVAKRTATSINRTASVSGVERIERRQFNSGYVPVISPQEAAQYFFEALEHDQSLLDIKVETVALKPSVIRMMHSYQYAGQRAAAHNA